MHYRIDPKSGNKLSILGFGCMRFPRTLGQLDMAKTEKLLLTAIDSGINYFDTAYVYGGSEEMLGAILHKNNVRSKIYLATKLPHGRCQRYEDFDMFFNAQLERLRTDYIDYYLIHNLSDLKSWTRVCDLGLERWLAEKKASGKIKQIGFSYHGSTADFTTLLDAYSWDFCQIQYNYMNTNYQAGTAGLKKAAERGMPVIVMEPLLGGKLSGGLPEKAVKVFKDRNPSLSPAAWALRWLWNQPEVTVVLSGMNEERQLLENNAVADSASTDMLTPKELGAYSTVTEVLRSSYKVPCTGCNYCMPCPQEINIPACFAAYNSSYALGFVAGVTAYATSTGITNPKENHSPSKCVGCGKCEVACPQHIAIRKELTNVTKRLEPAWMRAAIKVALKLMR